VSCILQGSCQSPTIELAENCARLGYYAASSRDFVPMFRDNLLIGFFITEVGCVYCSVQLTIFMQFIPALISVGIKSLATARAGLF
jgi:hypothetical protein